MSGNSDFLMDHVVYILIVLAFFLILIFLVARVGETSSGFEQVFAKKIALLVDNAKPGTIIELDADNFIYLSRKNKFNPVIKLENNQVYVKIYEKGGYYYTYFSDNNVTVLVNRDTSKIVLTIK